MNLNLKAGSRIQEQEASAPAGACSNGGSAACWEPGGINGAFGAYTAYCYGRGFKMMGPDSYSSYKSHLKLRPKAHSRGHRKSLAYMIQLLCLCFGACKYLCLGERYEYICTCRLQILHTGGSQDPSQSFQESGVLNMDPGK